MKKYYTPEQLEKLKKKREKLGEENTRSVEAEWKELFEKFKSEMDEGTDPSVEAVQELARHSQELIGVFSGGDPGIVQSLNNMYYQEGGPALMARHGVQLDPLVWECMGKAMTVLKKCLSL